MGLSVLCLGQNNFTKSQLFTVLTKTRWISFLKVAQLSASSASSSHSSPHRILPSRALATAWQSPLAWPPLCFSLSLWPPYPQTQSKTGSLEEQVRFCHPHLCCPHQNPSRKLKGRTRCQVAVWSGNWTSSEGLTDGIVSAQSAVMWRWGSWKKSSPSDSSVPPMKANPQRSAWASTKSNKSVSSFTFGGTVSHCFFVFKFDFLEKKKI